jgi:hypothetical protein
MDSPDTVGKIPSILSQRKDLLLHPNAVAEATVWGIHRIAGSRVLDNIPAFPRKVVARVDDFFHFF